MANICWTKRNIDNRQGRWKLRRVSYVVQKLHQLWSTNGLKPDRRCIVLSQSIAHPLCGINVAPHSDSRWNGIGFACSSDLRPQKMLNGKCYWIGRPWVAIHRYNCHISSVTFIITSLILFRPKWNRRCEKCTVHMKASHGFDIMAYTQETDSIGDSNRGIWCVQANT